MRRRVSRRTILQAKIGAERVGQPQGRLIGVHEWELVLCSSAVYGFGPSNLAWLESWRCVRPGDAEYEAYWWQFHDLGYFLISETQQFGEALARAANDGLRAVVLRCLAENESIFRLRLHEASKLDPAWLAEVSSLVRGMALEWRVVRQDTYELVPVGVYVPREQRLARAIAASVLAHTPVSCPDANNDLPGFVQYAAVHGSELPSSVWEDIKSAGRLKGRSLSSFRTDYRSFTALLAISDLYGFRPAADTRWNIWPLYYSVLDRETPHFWWDSSPLRVRSLDERDSQSLLAALGAAASDDMTKAARSVRSWVPSARRRRYLESLDQVSQELLRGFLGKAGPILRWTVFRDGSVMFD